MMNRLQCAPLQSPGFRSRKWNLLNYALCMRVLLVGFANKFTGAAAVAELSCRALRSVGVDSRLLFVAGRNLEERLAGERWASAGLVKERTPLRLAANLDTVREAAAESDAVICHLPHDHFLCLAAGLQQRSTMLRSLRHPGHLPGRPFHRFLLHRCAGLVLANSTMTTRVDEYATLVLPVPVEDRFAPSVDGRAWRERLRIDAQAPVIGMVGKLAAGRGFDLLLQTAARVSPRPQVIAVGVGEARPALEQLAAELQVEVLWAGYQEEGLPELYAAMDVVLFAVPGSDHGHRAITEAQACARPVVAAEIPGVEDLIEDRRTGRFVNGGAAAVAEVVSELLGDRVAASEMGNAAAETVYDRRFEAVGNRLAVFIASVCAAR